ncbi:hypothetical protein Rhal01_02020 [Rubritalea halochordaticola]|uniref:Uncharacterized protein n=1 Tax=Rubritalea halochordaticola TaxID=714537 RepID=A0ABP9UZH0_9BACT
MKDSFGNTFNKTVATGIISVVTLLLFVTTAVANSRLGFAVYLPCIILLTSSLSIASIWIFGRPRKPDSPAINQLEAMQKKIAELEKRLSNAELVNNFEDRLAEKEANFRHSNNSAEHSPTMGPTQSSPSSDAMPTAE